MPTSKLNAPIFTWCFQRVVSTLGLPLVGEMIQFDKKYPFKWGHLNHQRDALLVDIAHTLCVPGNIDESL